RHVLRRITSAPRNSGDKATRKCASHRGYAEGIGISDVRPIDPPAQGDNRDAEPCHPCSPRPGDAASQRRGPEVSTALLEAHPVQPDDSLLPRAESWLGHAIEIPAAALVVGEVVVLLAGVIMRFIFNSPIPWADELASILFLWLANLGAAVALRRGSHMRTTALVSRWGPRARAWAETLAIAVPCLMLVILIG